MTKNQRTHALHMFNTCAEETATERLAAVLIASVGRRRRRCHHHRHRIASTCIGANFERQPPHQSTNDNVRMGNWNELKINKDPTESYYNFYVIRTSLWIRQFEDTATNVYQFVSSDFRLVQVAIIMFENLTKIASLVQLSFWTLSKHNKKNHQIYRNNHVKWNWKV